MTIQKTPPKEAAKDTKLTRAQCFFAKKELEDELRRRGPGARMMTFATRVSPGLEREGHVFLSEFSALPGHGIVHYSGDSHLVQDAWMAAGRLLKLSGFGVQ